MPISSIRFSILFFLFQPEYSDLNQSFSFIYTNHLSKVDRVVIGRRYMLVPD